MPRVVLFVAASLDGFIARQDGSVDWLESNATVNDDETMTACARFYETVDGLVMGRRTYDQVLGFGSWPYEGKPCRVFTHRPAAPDPNVEFVSTDASETALEQLLPDGDELIWLVGGADLVGQFASAGLIDEYQITVIPTVLGSGIPLFPRGTPETRMRLIGTEAIGGTVALRDATP